MFYLKGINPNSLPVINKKKKRENTRKKKKSHTQDNIYVVRQICLRLRSCKDFTVIREEYKMQLQICLLAKASAPWTKPQ